jgi:Flp pilus assembly protein TadG
MMTRCLPRIARDERGTSMIELALIAPLLVFMVMGLTDLARGLAERLSLEQAASRALEKASVGSVQSDYSLLAAEAAAGAGTGATASVDQWAECDGTRQPSFDTVCSDGQMSARYVKVTVSRDFTPSFRYVRSSWKFLNTNANGSITLTGSAAVRVQ